MLCEGFLQVCCRFGRCEGAAEFCVETACRTAARIQQMQQHCWRLCANTGKWQLAGEVTDRRGSSIAGGCGKTRQQASSIQCVAATGEAECSSSCAGGCSRLAGWRLAGRLRDSSNNGKQQQQQDRRLATCRTGFGAAAAGEWLAGPLISWQQQPLVIGLQASDLQDRFGAAATGEWLAGPVSKVRE
jgi:hypothetical protein